MNLNFQKNKQDSADSPKLLPAASLVEKRPFPMSSLGKCPSLSMAPDSAEAVSSLPIGF